MKYPRIWSGLLCLSCCILCLGELIQLIHDFKNHLFPDDFSIHNQVLPTSPRSQDLCKPREYSSKLSGGISKAWYIPLPSTICLSCQACFLIFLIPVNGFIFYPFVKIEKNLFESPFSSFFISSSPVSLNHISLRQSSLS